MLKRFFIAFFLIITVCSLKTLAQQVTGDPWIFQTYKELYNRQPSAWELNIKNYNLGSWNSYDELKRYVQEYQNSLRLENYTVKTTGLKNNQSAAIFYQNGTPVASALISNAGGYLVGNDGASLIGNDSAGLIGLDGSTLRNLSVLSFADMATKFTQASGMRYIKASGRGRLVMKKR